MYRAGIRHQKSKGPRTPFFKLSCLAHSVHTRNNCSKVLRPLFVSDGKVLQGYHEVINRGLEAMFHAVMWTGSWGHCHSQLLSCKLPHFLHITAAKYTAEAQSINYTRYWRHLPCLQRAGCAVKRHRQSHPHNGVTRFVQWPQRRCKGKPCSSGVVTYPSHNGTLPTLV